MKNLIIVLIAIATTYATAQNTIEWIGGAPGYATAWDEPRNWNTNNVPDEFSYVTISSKNGDRTPQPVIDGLVKVKAIEVQFGATLTVTENGYLIIDGTDANSEGLLIYKDNIHNTGTMNLRNFASKYVINDSTILGINTIEKNVRSGVWTIAF